MKVGITPDSLKIKIEQFGHGKESISGGMGPNKQAVYTKLKMAFASSKEAEVKFGTNERATSIGDFSVIDGHLCNEDLLEIDKISYSAWIREMAEEDAFLVDDIEGGLCVDNTDAGIDGRFNSGSNKDKGKDSLESKYMAEDSSNSEKGKGKEVDGPSVNMTEEGKNKNNKQIKEKKRDFKEHGSGSGSNKKPKLECWKYGKIGHFNRDFRSGNKKNANAGGWERVDAIAWWIDSGATTHVYKDRCWFKTYEPVEDERTLHGSE
ncbi:hypothetical protein Tco_0551033 [Tanacetum coccineum]